MIDSGVRSLCASAAGWVQMRCRECAAEVAVTARACSRCGAPIVGQPPVVADTVVADTVVAAVSDAAGKAVPAGVAGQAPPEPYVPGSGEGSLRSFGWCWLDTPVLLVACSLAPWPAPRLSSFSFAVDDLDVQRAVVRLGPRGVFLGALWGWAGVRGARGGYPVFQAAPAAQRSTHGDGDGLEAWWAHADT